MGNGDSVVEERMTYTVAEAAKLLGIGQRQAYEAVHVQTIPSIRIGTRILIPRRALEHLLEGASTAIEAALTE